MCGQDDLLAVAGEFQQCLNEIPHQLGVEVGFRLVPQQRAGAAGVEAAVAEQALQGATPPAQAALAQLQSARNWVIGCSVVVFVLALVATLSLRASIVAPLNQAILIAETVASGDLSQEFNSDLEGDFGRLLGALGTMEDTLTDLVSRIKQSTDSITASAADIDHGNTDPCVARKTRCRP